MITITNIQNILQLQQVVEHQNGKPINSVVTFPTVAHFADSSHGYTEGSEDRTLTYIQYVKENRLTLIADV